jgi:hypothetical protein
MVPEVASHEHNEIGAPYRTGGHQRPGRGVPCITGWCPDVLIAPSFSGGINGAVVAVVGIAWCCPDVLSLQG